MSSSEDSEDENVKQLAEAVDTSLFNNKFYVSKEENDEKGEEQKIEHKSQRYLDNTENIFQSDLNISENMKQFIGKKMSKLIEESIEFVDLKNHSKICEKEEESDCTRLLKGCKEYISINQSDQHYFPQHKIAIKRRKVDDEDELNESSKVKLASIDMSEIQQETNLWNMKSKHEVLKYKKGKDQQCHMIEKPNEYSKSRSKNGWNESKIKTAKYFNQGLCSVINKK